MCSRNLTLPFNLPQKRAIQGLHSVTNDATDCGQSGGQNQQWPTNGRIGYITPAVWGSPTLQSGGENQQWPTNGRFLTNIFYIIEKKNLGNFFT